MHFDTLLFKNEILAVCLALLKTKFCILYFWTGIFVFGTIFVFLDEILLFLSRIFIFLNFWDVTKFCIFEAITKFCIFDTMTKFCISEVMTNFCIFDTMTKFCIFWNFVSISKIKISLLPQNLQLRHQNVKFRS